MTRCYRPVIILDAGNGTGKQLNLPAVRTRQLALKIARKACQSNPDAIGFSVV